MNSLGLNLVNLRLVTSVVHILLKTEGRDVCAENLDGKYKINVADLLVLGFNWQKNEVTTMKTKHNLFATGSLSAKSANNQEKLTANAFPFSTKKSLRQFIQLALVGSVLVSNMASAVLQDHGPGDPTLLFPLWYRDTNNLAIGLCKSPALNAASARLCFPFVSDPAGFAGNVGPEVFYNMIEFKSASIPTGTDFKYRVLIGLESSYLPAGVPIHGTETVFARVRIGLNFNDPLKNGTYTVTHPFGTQTFTDLQATDTSNVFGAGIAEFFTADVPLGVPNNYELALGGALGPFITWDADYPVVGSNGDTFVGDPNILHTFTGSPFGTNFLRIDGPPGSGIGTDPATGAAQDFILVNVANIIGQIWTAPIAQPLAIDSAYKTRSSTTNGVDVWATSSANQRLILTGTGMPSIQMLPDGTTPGKYHAHVEFPAPALVPASVTVTNLASIPVNGITTAVHDSVLISKAEFNTTTRQISIAAHSSDQVGLPALNVQGIPGVPSAVGVVPAVTGALTSAQCTTPGFTAPYPGVDLCFTYTLPAGKEPPEKISIASAGLDSRATHLLDIVGTPENAPNPPVATNASFANVAQGGTTALQVTANGSATSLPADVQIIQQPANGTITCTPIACSFTANVGVTALSDTFQFVRQSVANAPVSNVATGRLTLTFVPRAPTAVADQAAGQSRTPRILRILDNDRAASANAVDRINPASVQFVTRPGNGTVVANPDGTVTYTANNTSPDSFTYKVSNSVTPTAQASNTATVTITNFGGAEVVSIGTDNYTTAQNKWTIVGNTTWFGANLTSATATCWTGVAPSTPTPTTLIGTAPIDNTGKFTVSVVGGTAPVATAGLPILCQSTYGAIGRATTTLK